jgi:photosystem II stability/assembly factor-like uncharacterized protein
MNIKSSFLHTRFGLPKLSRAHWASLAVSMAIAIICSSAQVAFATDLVFAIKSGLAPHSLLLSGCELEGRLVAVGERGHIVLSDDAGASWRQAQAVPTRTTLTAIYFHGAKLGWAIGHDATILRTTDGGENWTQLYSAPELDQPLMDVWFKDDKTGFAIGAYGYFLVTNDGGESWEERRVSEDDDWHLNHIESADNGSLYIAAETGTLYRSDDGGDNWRTMLVPYEGSLYGTLSLGGDELLVYGLRGNAFHSRDGGESWNKVETGTEALLTNAHLLEGGKVLVSGMGGTLLLGSGEPLVFKAVKMTSRKDIAGIVPVGQTSVVILGQGGAEKVAVEMADVVKSEDQNVSK